jgi:integrase
MVSTTHQLIGGPSSGASPVAKSTPASPRSNPSIIAQGPSSVDGLANNGLSEAPTGLSESANNLIFKSVRESTRRSYAGCWNRWLCWNKKRSQDPLDTSVERLCNYLASLSDEGLGASSLNIHKSAIFYFLCLKDRKYDSMVHAVILNRLIKGAFNSRPPTRRTQVWEVSQVLNLLESWGPNNSLSLNHLFLKSLTLTALVTACRVSELANLSNEIQRFTDRWVLRINQWKKNSSIRNTDLSYYF